MKTLKILKKVLFGIVEVIYFAFALFMTILLLNYNKYGVTQFGDTSVVIIKEDVELDEYKKGDVVLVKAVKVKDIESEDIIFTYKLDEERVAHIEVGKVGEVYEEEDAITLKNGSTYSAEFIAGKGYKTYNGIGSFLSVIESQWGFLFLVLVPIFLIFIYQVYALIIEIKYGVSKE